jgi:Xaa-Pro aminopeptidase
MFEYDFFAGNRARLRQLFTGTAPIVITANGRLQQTADEAYAFSQDSNFWYLTGIDEPDVVLIMEQNKEYLILPERTQVSEIFDGAISTEDVSSISGIKEVYTEKEGWKYFGSRLKRLRHVATLGANPPYMETFGMYANPARGVLIQRLKEYNANLELLDIRLHLARQRMIKQEPEMVALQKAIDITLDTLKTISKPSTLKRYAYEYEIEADISRGFRRAGAQGHAFTPIVAAGEHAVTLHNIANEGKLASDELLVADVGAQYNHYAADITRTFDLGAAPKRALNVHAAVLEVYSYACSLLKPGVLMRDYEKEVETFMGEKLRELGLIKVIERSDVRKYFPHATSHYLGLDAHDAGDYDRPLEPGVVMTVEPGIYIPEEGIGIRVEDDVLITSSGIEVLSARLPLVLT